MIRRAVFVFISVLLSFLSFSQIHPELVKKFSPTLQQQLIIKKQDQSSQFVIAVSDVSVFTLFLKKNPGIPVVYGFTLTNTFIIRATWRDIIEKILPRPEVLFIDEQRTAKEEVAVSNLDMSTNKVNLLHHRFAAYNGQTITASVKENRPDTADADLKGRYIFTPSSSATLSSHATIMSTIIAGAGNSYYEGRGVVAGAAITSTTFAILLPEPDSYYQQYGISTQNHSYGTVIDNFYGADAAAYDASVVNRPSLAHVFSAGNSGTLTSTAGPYAGITSYANITGSFKMAKNIITVGHTDSFSAVLTPSSKGPAYDGSVRPHLVAFGEDGSSGAAAIVSGTAIALQHAYKQLQGTLPPASLIKATLLNSANDAGAKGIDFTAGYGSVNAVKAMETIVNGRYLNGSATDGATVSYDLVVPANISRLKIILAWTDPPAAPNAAKSLKHDLDLELAFPAGGQTWLPWVLNHYPHIDSLRQLPLRKRDSLNTTEQITIDNPVAGNYSIRVKGYSITAAATQPYAIAYQFDTLDHFRWYYPSASDNIFGGKVNVLRWESSYTAPAAQLEYSSDNGSNWQLIANNINLATGYYKWNAPDTFTTSLLRMNVSSQNFVSDTFTISGRINTFVGFDCPDSFLFYWNKNKGVAQYRVFRLGEKYMEPFQVTADTVVVLGKQTNPAVYYAIAPLLKNKTGVRGFGFDYRQQGVGCYIKSFFVQQSSASALLDLELGTSYSIKTITWEKLTLNGYVSLQTITAISGVTYSYSDASLHTGANTYRVRLELYNGNLIYSSAETIYYFNQDHLLYPNPVLSGQPLNIISKNPDNSTLLLFNSAGVRVGTYLLDEAIETIPVNKFAPGIYFIKIISPMGGTSVYKLVII
jgi:hypothetical protein